MAIFESLSTLTGAPLQEAELEGRAVLVVNVASRCGLTPQYTGLEQPADLLRIQPHLHS